MSTSSLTSTRNPILQSIRRAAADGRPTENGLVVAEGPHLIEEALRGEWRIEQILATASARERHASLLSRVDAEIVEVSTRAFSSLASTETSQELLALLRPRTWRWDDLAPDGALIVALDGIQDPGNAGTIVRSAEAFGASGVVMLPGSVRVANGKFLRATAGSIFRVPYLEACTSETLVDECGDRNIKICGLNQSALTPIEQADFRAPCALAVGSEAHGVSRQLARHMHAISIPMTKVESLNAAVACSIALFEARRQRMAHEPV
jgi:RNA methyltransferase, TrmH family